MSNDFWKDYEPEPTRPAPMTKDEALDLALEALENCYAYLHEDEDIPVAITAIKQARALDKKAENAKELGLDYEPVQKQRWAVFCSFCNKEWSVSYQHPGKSVCLDCDDAPPAQPAPDCKETGVCVQTGLACFGQAAQPAPVQEPVALTDDEIWKFWWNKPEVPEGEDDSMEAQFVSACREAIKAAAQRPFVGLTDEELNNFLKAVWGREVTPKHFIQAIEAKLKEKNT
jgi:hypothetical protein